MAAALGVFVVPVPVAHAAATITVTTTTDELADPGPGTGCSLREAIQSANGDADFGGCTAAGAYGTDTIVLEAGKTYTLSITGTGEDANATGDLDITDTAGLTIETDAPGSTATIDADAIDRVIEMHEGPLTLVDLIVEDGVAGAANGGGIRALDGDLTLTRCTVRDNTATDGGGIVAQYSGTSGSGTLTITEITISDNTITGFGGTLLASDASLMVDIRNSTRAGNIAGLIDESLYFSLKRYSVHVEQYDSGNLLTSIPTSSDGNIVRQIQIQM